MSDLNDDPKTTAAELGLEYVTPGPYDVFLDIDDIPSGAHMQRMFDLLRKNKIEFTEMKRTTSKSGNTHVYIRFTRAVGDIERIALQACMGSDRTRELLSVLRIWANTTRPTHGFLRKTGTRRSESFPVVARTVITR